MQRVDIAIIGGGMAGISLGATLVGNADVLVLEREDMPGYHATGRSVAFWTESYGGPAVQPLTSAAGPLLARPDPLFSERPLLSPRGAIHIGRESDRLAGAEMIALFGGQGVEMAPCDRAALAAAVPGLRPDWTLGVAEPSCADIDTAGLLDAYRRQLQRNGGTLRCGVAFRGAVRTGGRWRIDTSNGPVEAEVLVNAAGAWADEVAQLSGLAPVGITPLRRTVLQLRTEPGAPDAMPLIIDLSERFYFKSVGQGRLWLTPHDETPDSPGDVAPDDLAVATAIARFEDVVDWRIAAVERKWAGLRSFAPDRAPVYGRDPVQPDFFWFAGQGGFGIQTAPAAALVAASLLTGATLPDTVRHIDATRYAPDRFSRAKANAY